MSFAFILFSCNSKENNTTENNDEINSRNLKLANDLANKPKIFLKFWRNMSVQEFDTVVKILISEKVLEQKSYRAIYYLTPKCKSELKPIFVNDSLKQLELLNGICLYDIFKEKYNLPDLLEKRLVERRYIEKNLEYNPVMSYMTDKGEKKLPNCFIDKSSYSINGEQNLPIEENGLKEKILPNSPLIIKKANCVIIFKQNFYKAPTPLTTYSLDLNPEMEQYKMQNPLLALSEEGKYISRNSKYKINEIISSSVITITYQSDIDYNEKVQKEIQKSQSLKKEVEQQEIENRSRNEAVKNEL
mgnify:CR=1 FL=1